MTLTAKKETMKYIIELEPGLFLRHGPVIRYIVTSQRHKAERYDSAERAAADIDNARADRRARRRLSSDSVIWKGAEIIEVES